MKNLTKKQQIQQFHGIHINGELVSKDFLGNCDLCNDYFSQYDLRWNFKGSKLYCKICRHPEE